MAIESDITERKRSQVALEEHSQHLEQLVEARTDELQRVIRRSLKPSSKRHRMVCC